VGWFVTSVSTDDRVARFTALFDEYVPVVRGFVRTQVVAADVESIVQATFETAWVKLDVIPLLSQRAWLFGVARNHVRNLVRADRRREALVDALSALRPPDTVGLFAVAVDPAVVDAWVGALAELSETDREVVQLSVWHGLDAAEVGQVLGISPGNVRVRLHRSRCRLSILMADGEVES